MAKVSKDSSAYHVQGVLVRDERNTKITTEVPGHRKNWSRDKKRWCKGIEGEQHHPSWKPVPFNPGSFTFKIEETCDRCGKNFGMHWLASIDRNTKFEKVQELIAKECEKRNKKG